MFGLFGDDFNQRNVLIFFVFVFVFFCATVRQRPMVLSVANRFSTKSRFKCYNKITCTLLQYIPRFSVLVPPIAQGELFLHCMSALAQLQAGLSVMDEIDRLLNEYDATKETELTIVASRKLKDVSLVLKSLAQDPEAKTDTTRPFMVSLSSR